MKCTGGKDVERLELQVNRPPRAWHRRGGRCPHQIWRAGRLVYDGAQIPVTWDWGPQVGRCTGVRVTEAGLVASVEIDRPIPAGTLAEGMSFRVRHQGSIASQWLEVRVGDTCRVLPI